MFKIWNFRFLYKGVFAFTIRTKISERETIMATEIKLKDEERTRCEVWTRVMGYHRPVHAYNIGKKQEFADRKYFTESKTTKHLEGRGW